MSEDGSALFRSHFCARTSDGNLDLHAAAISQLRKVAIEHVHFSGSHVTFREVNTRPIRIFDTLFPSLYTLNIMGHPYIMRDDKF